MGAPFNPFHRAAFAEAARFFVKTSKKGGPEEPPFRVLDGPAAAAAF